MQTAYSFFLKHAGWGYRPGFETPIQGRRRGARALARAEKSAADCSFEWSIDPDVDSSDWIDDNDDGGKNCDPWATWQCVMRDDTGRAVASLHGIDFGRGGEPWGDPYRRVVEAELSIEWGGK